MPANHSSLETGDCRQALHLPTGIAAQADRPSWDLSTRKRRRTCLERVAHSEVSGCWTKRKLK